MLALELHEEWGDGIDINTPLDELIALESTAERLFELTHPDVDRSAFINSFIEDQIEDRKHAC